MKDTGIVAGVIQELEAMIKLLEAKKVHFRHIEAYHKVGLADDVIEKLREAIEDFKGFRR